MPNNVTITVVHQLALDLVNIINLTMSIISHNIAHTIKVVALGIVALETEASEILVLETEALEVVASEGAASGGEVLVAEGEVLEDFANKMLNYTA